MNKLSGWDDTIVALATPPGIGAIGVIRVSGEKTFAILNELFPSKDLTTQLSHTIQVGFLKDDEKLLDEVVLSLFKGPKSYTGEDVIEVGCHGSPFIQQQIIDALIKKGCRIAKPGEFTQRAFLNGKLDLAQAEAVADLIASNTEASHRAALHTMRGGFSEKLVELRERLISFSALIELELDFSQEDVEFADRTQFYALIGELKDSTDRLLNSFKLGNVIRNGVTAAIVGKPNAGKSTLLNTLLNENRAIVSEIPGTTRDTIEEIINIDGILFRLIDTAGIRAHSGDLIESMGIEKSLAKMQEASLVVYLFDVNDTTAEELSTTKKEMDAKGLHYLLVGNKTDTTNEASVQQKFSAIHPLIFIAAKTQWHTDILRQQMVAAILEGTINTENTIVTNARHYAALKEVSQSLTDIKNGLDNHLPGDLLALDIRNCLHWLGEITGEITHEDQLDWIFLKFCIGK